MNFLSLDFLKTKTEKKVGRKGRRLSYTRPVHKSMREVPKVEVAEEKKVETPKVETPKSPTSTLRERFMEARKNEN